ncbi:TPA: hypothetical protein U1248_002049, partial [Streptococcus suis]|nr:hypothetical protein [Streptococcus suis]
SNDGGTWFGLRTADGQMLVERFRYDVGLEGESISERLNRILSPAHLEQIRQIDTNFDIPSYVEDKNKELGIEVKLYRDKEHIDTLDFNDLINHPNIEEMANELGHTSLSSYPEEFTIEILDKRLNQSQLTVLLDQIIELDKEKDGLKQFLTEQLTSLSQSTRPDIFRALTENERTHISEFFKTLIPNVTTSYEFTEEGVEYLSYRIRNMEFASSHPELRELSPEEQYQSLLKFFDKHYGKPFPLPSDQTVMGIELLQEKFGYNPKLPLAVYRDSAQNMDRIAEKEEEAFHSTFDKTMFAKSLELVQKYSLQEVMEGIDIWSGGDEARLEALNSDLRDISLQPLKDFVERYIDPSLYLSHGFEDSPLASLSFQDLADLSHEKGLLDVNEISAVEPWKLSTVTQVVEYLSTVERKDLPTNIQTSDRIQELLGQVEELGQNAYFWVSEEDLNQPREIVEQLDNWFSSGQADSTYKSDLFGLSVGDYTYMIEFKDGATSLQNMKAYAQTISEQIEEVGVDAVVLELESTIADFNQVKQSLTEGMDKQLQAIQQSLLRQHSPVESVQAGIGRFFERMQKQARAIFEPDISSDHKENALEQAQGHKKSAEGTIGDFPAEQEAAPLPEANESQPLNDLSPSQTQPQPLLHFTTKDDGKSIEKRYYHLASEKDIAKLNRYAPTIQQTAQWYLDAIADSHVIYLYKDGDSISSLAVQFDRDKFMHLTGIFPYREHQTASQTLEDFANGKGDFDSILIANKGAAFDKIKVLPELEAIIQSDSFYFGDLSEVPKLKQLDMDKAIRSGDEDVVLAMRTVDGTTFPASLLKLRQTLALQLEHSTEERTILGVYRYRDTQLDQLSINQEYIKDGGEVFKPILEQVVENLNQSTSSEPNMEEDMVYQDQPLVQHQLEPDKQEEAKPEPVDSTFYTQTSNQNKLSELLASKDRAGLAQHLKEGVHQYLNSEQYKDFLNTMSRFPNYSYRNIQLLKAQMPTVQAVASFKSWKEDFGRTVIKGSKSLRIFAPQITKLRDPQTGEVLKDEQGNDKTRITFKLVPVFDISQTEGKELPKPIYQLEGNYENYSKLYRSAKAYVQSKGLTMEFNSNIGEANGYYSRKENKIVIKAGMSEQQTLKTIYHELAHADLHSSQTVTKDLQYSDAELQAESVAYVVANHYGLDTSEYSFGYLATWVRDKEALSDLEAQLEIVQKEAQHLINSLDRELEKQLEQAQVQTVEKVEPVEKLSFEERLARAEQESKLLAEEQGREEEQAKKQEAKQFIQER